MNQEIIFEIKKFSGVPSSLVFTDRSKLTNLPQIIKNLPKNSAIILREYDLSESGRQNLMQEIRQITNAKLPSQRPKIFVGKNWRLAKKLQADGVHFSDRDSMIKPQKLANFLRKKFPKNFQTSYACHSVKSWQEAFVSKLDLIVISPIFKTASHFETTPIGLHNMAKISSKNLLSKSRNRSSRQKIYALGGVNNKNLRQLRKLGIGGFGAINFFEKNL
jgi:thiamine monophosphate synthase